ncbi:MAG: 2OG-Fe(II) oxygenase family protein, partial [Myxococcota bacterium]
PHIHAENIWPDWLTSFADHYLTVGQQLHAAGLRILAGCALALGLDDETTFTATVDGGPHVFRLLRYLPVTAEQVEQGVLWGEEHTDFNLLTLLPGGRFFDPDGAPCARPDTESGLYLRTRGHRSETGEQIHGVAPAGCIVAQVGQQLEILSGGRFLATPHEIRPPRRPGFSRMSAAHFIHMRSDAIVFPLEPFCDEEAVVAYRPPRTAGTYGLKTLVDIGLAPPEALAELGYRQYGRLAAIRADEAS